MTSAIGKSTITDTIARESTMGGAAGAMRSATKVTLIDVSATKWSKEIDERLIEEKNHNLRMIKMLLLGAGESGKSTFVKQMRIIHSTGFSDFERSNYRLIINSNVVQSVQSILDAMKKLDMEFENADRKADAKFCTDHTYLVECGAMDIVLPLAAAIGRLWRDKVFYHCYLRSNEYQLIDSAGYFFDEIFRLADPDYTPTDQDIVRARLRTTGVCETRFRYKNTPFRLLDVGGQRTERRKWIHVFDDVTVMIFLIALSEYDMTLREDNMSNRLEESRVIFNSVCNSAWFINRPVIIFFNKADIFAEKIARTPLTVCFPEYKGKRSEIASREYICKKFLKLNNNRKRELYHHYTIATDTKNIEFVFDASMDAIMKVNLKSIGML